jgi:hypothetical protein
MTMHISPQQTHTKTNTTTATVKEWLEENTGWRGRYFILCKVVFNYETPQAGNLVLSLPSRYQDMQYTQQSINRSTTQPSSEDG